MNLLTLIHIATQAMVRNRMRTLLSMLGVIIGVGAVITMMAVGEGSKESIKKQIGAMGSNLIMIYPSRDFVGGVRQEAGSSSKLTSDDLELLLSLPGIEAGSPYVANHGQLIYRNKNWPSQAQGVNAQYLNVKNLNMGQGSMFNERHVRIAAKVGVIGTTIQENLFDKGDNPIGKTIRINSLPIRIIGILESKGTNAFGQDQDDIILVPYTTLQKRVLASSDLRRIELSADESMSIDTIVASVKKNLAKAHRVSEDNPDFHVRTQAEIIQAVSSTSEMLTMVLTAIASISLLVGGIGIMNIMLVSVTERTREIGLRMALGATGKNILLQFLLESVLISLTGGVLGILLGIGTATLLQKFMAWPIMISITSIVLAFSTCFLTGAFFGWAPARKAASLNPIEALRYE